MRWVILTVCGLLVGSRASAEPIPAAATPEQHVRVAAAYLRRLQPVDRANTRFLSWIGSPSKLLVERQQVQIFWLNHLSQEPDISLPREVPGSGGRLWAVDLRDFGWNAEAWRVVALREPYFREPWISHAAAKEIRDLIYTDVDKTTFHVEAVVRADWLFRETAESDRSTSYYDLLWARQRFGDREYWPGDSKYPANWYFKGKGKQDSGFINADFPRDENDWEKAFGADKIFEILRQENRKIDHGAVVDKNVSIVARNNRLIVRASLQDDYYYVTRDVVKTAGRKDFVENLHFNIDADAGELIFRLRNGAQAYLLINKDKKRVETADNKVAIDSTDPNDRRVRTPGSCVICHGPGINRPDNKIEQLLRQGFDIRFRDGHKLREVRDFYLNWDVKLTADQTSYNTFCRRTAGRTGEQTAIAFQRYRDSYDLPVDLAQACLETGLTEKEFRQAVVYRTNDGKVQASPHFRPLDLIRGNRIPRETWEEDTFREVMLLESVTQTLTRKVYP